MSDGNDIVARLRDTTSGYTLQTVFDEAAASIERLRAERDEARREVCSMNKTGLRMNESDKRREAKRRGWDCFGDESPDSDPKSFITAIAEEIGDDVMTWSSDLDRAVVGFAERCGMATVLVYDYDTVHAILSESMGGDAATEFIDFNIIGAWCGERTPIMLHRGGTKHDR